MLWREVTSKEFLTNNKELLEVKLYRREEVAKVVRETAEVVDMAGSSQPYI